MIRWGSDDQQAKLAHEILTDSMIVLFFLLAFFLMFGVGYKAGKTSVETTQCIELEEIIAHP